jgi:hypothetical protein
VEPKGKCGELYRRPKRHLRLTNKNEEEEEK